MRRQLLEIVLILVSVVFLTGWATLRQHSVGPTTHGLQSEPGFSTTPDQGFFLELAMYRTGRQLTVDMATPYYRNSIFADGHVECALTVNPSVLQKLPKRVLEGKALSRLKERLQLEQFFNLPQTLAVGSTVDPANNKLFVLRCKWNGLVHTVEVRAPRLQPSDDQMSRFVNVWLTAYWSGVDKHTRQLNPDYYRHLECEFL